MPDGNISKGDKIEVKTKDKIYRGVYIPRSELMDDDCIIIKLENGYNIGIKKEHIECINLIEKKAEDKLDKFKAVKEKFGKSTENKKTENKKISILSTGGTIAARVDYTTGGVFSAFTADELISAIPELEEIAEISGRQIFNKFSENMCPDDWIKIAESTFEEIKKGADGVVITHGTDTMHYTSAALSFMLHTPVSVVITGAQRSSDRGSSDAAINLINSAYFSLSKNPGVFVVMHESMDDNWCSVYRGTRVRKMHSSRRDAFSGDKFGRVFYDERKIEIYDKIYDKEFSKSCEELKIDTRIEKKVALIKYFPGMTAEIFEILSSEFKGIILEGTGLGHVSETLIPSIKKAIEDGVFIGMTTQTVYGRVNMNVYSTGRLLKKAGVIGCEDMFSEVAYVKLMYALAHYSEHEKVKEFMLENIAGEITERSPI